MVKYSKARIAEIEKNKEEFRQLLPPGSTVYTSLNHVSRSGMQRAISVYIIRNNNISDISYDVAEIIGDTMHKKGGIKINGCGMDMGFSIVYQLSYKLYPNGFECIGEHPVRCPSNDHCNGDRNYEPHHHNSGGYALIHRWL